MVTPKVKKSHRLVASIILTRPRDETIGELEEYLMRFGFELDTVRAYRDDEEYLLVAQKRSL